MSARPFRFGAMAWRAPDAGGWAGLARHVESLGFSTLVMGDHMWDQFAPVPALLAAALATTRLRVGSLMFGNDYRHPVVLAKELATLDVLSGGRLEVGIGAGWRTRDYEGAGIPMAGPGERIERLEESVAVLRGLWSGEKFSFSGQHYTVDSLRGTPVPVQRPHPKLLLGGGGPKMLATAARLADIVGINPALGGGVLAGRDATMRASEERIDVVRTHAGPRLDAIELSMMCHVASTEDDAEAMAPQLARYGIGVEQRHDSPHVWLGRPDDMAEELVRIRDRLGVSYWIVQQEMLDAVAPVVERLTGR